jgi:hypothetical protein
MFNKRFAKTCGIGQLLQKCEEKVEEEGKSESDSEKKKKGKVRVDLVKLFNDLGAPECINKL